MVRFGLIAPLALLAACASAADQSPPAQGASGSDGTLFVANKRGASLSRIDLATGKETHRAQTCENPHELTVSPDDMRVMVACYSGQSVEVFNARDLARDATIELGDGARVHSALWLDDYRVVAGAEGRGSLYVIDNLAANDPALTEIGAGGPGPHLVAVNAAGSMAWGTIIPAGEVVRYDLETGREAARRTIGKQIEAIALSPDGSSLWVASNADSIVYRLDPVSLEAVAEVATGAVPIRLAMHPDGQFVVSSNLGNGDLSVIDTATDTVVRTITVSGSRDAMQVTLAFSADGSRLYAAETGRNLIAEIDFASGKVLRRLATGEGGDGLAIIE